MADLLRCELFPRDLDAAVRFYTEVLGFEVDRDEGSSVSPYVALHRGAARLGLARRGDVVDATHRRPPAGVELVLEVHDLTAARERILAAGWRVEEDLTSRPWGLIDVRVLDPDGYYWRLTGPAVEVREGPPSELLDRCASLLDSDTVSTNVVATVATAEADRGQARSSYLWLERGGEPTAVAVVTPGLPVALSRCDDAEAAAFADALLDRGADVMGAAGPESSARAFARRWTARTGTVVAREMRQGVYVCDEVRGPAGVPGASRLAAPSDAALVTGWLRDFAVEAGLDPAPPHLVSTMLAERRVHLWTVPATGVPGTTVADEAAGDEAVALLAVRTSRAGMARVGPVWTPPDRRRRGYASALTADVTAQALALGHRAMLFTDLENPTSNGIYQAVGYRRDGDAVMLRF